MVEWSKIFKRGSLISILLFVPLVFVDSFRTYAYVTPISIVSCYSILVNLPILPLLMHRKPVWYDDLVDSTAVTDAAKRRFQKQFVRLLRVLMALVFTAIVDYGLFRFQSSQFSWLETLALFGGLLSLFGKVQNSLGSLLLSYIAGRKHRALSISMIHLDSGGEPRNPVSSQPLAQQNYETVV